MLKNDEPKNDEAQTSELARRITGAPRPTRTVTFPRKGVDGEPIGSLRMRVLTQEEQMTATSEAHRFAARMLGERKPGESIGYDALYARRVCVEILHRACRDENDAAPAFPTAKVLQAQLTETEVEVLLAHYEATLAHFDPAADEEDPGTDDDDDGEWIASAREELARGRDAPRTTLAVFDPGGPR